MKRPDIGIIGGGMFGLSIAWFAARSGMKVELFEARSPGAGASGGLIGALSPHMPEKWNAKKDFQFRALTSAAAFWQDIEDAAQMPTGYHRPGRIMPIPTEARRAMALDRADQAAQLWQGKANWSVIPAHPAIPDAPFGLVHETLSAQVFPRAAIAALARACKVAGVVIHKGTRARPDDLAAPVRIIAAGHECAQIVPDFPGSFSRGVKGQSALLDTEIPALPIVFDDGLYVVSHPGQGTAVGSTSEKDWTDPVSTDAALDDLIARARNLVPQLATAQVTDRWAGVRPRARLPDPAIGELSDGLWLATGGFKIGLALGHEIGRAIVGMINGKDLSLPPSFTLAHHLQRDA